MSYNENFSRKEENIARNTINTSRNDNNNCETIERVHAECRHNVPISKTVPVTVFEDVETIINLEDVDSIDIKLKIDVQPTLIINKKVNVKCIAEPACKPCKVEYRDCGQ